MKRSLLAIWVALLFVAGCSNAEEPDMLLEPPPPGLKAEPRWLTFTCVEPGCETTLTTTIEVEGPRDVAIKRILLSEDDRADFKITPAQTPPFVLPANEVLEVTVEYEPTGDPRLGDVDLLVTYTDAAAADTEGRLDAGELNVPLVRRVIGEPKLEINPERVVFGAVLPTARATEQVTISNVGYGNVGLVIESIEADPAAEIRVENLPPHAIVPGESWDLEVTYAPVQESFLRGKLTIQAAEPVVIPAEVELIGTSIPHPELAVRPAGGIDLGEIPVGALKTAELELENMGAEPLYIRHMEIVDPINLGNLSIDASRSATTATVAPLATELLTFTFEAETAGEIDTLFRIESDDPDDAVLDVPVIGLVTRPVIEVSPGGLDFGTVPRGWTTVLPIEISNSGFGELVVSNVSLVLGSSELFTLRTVPSLPITLRHAQRAGIEIEFRSEAEAAFNGIISIDSNDPDTPFIEIPLAAVGASCEAGCPIANGTPTCGSGLCEIDSCNTDWYDADLDPVNGCECREINDDPGSFCADGVYLGTLVDEDDDRASYTGILPLEDDVDMIRFFAEDAFGFGSDDFDVRVTLESSDPGISMCVYRHDTGSHASECVLENERCPSNRRYDRDGDTGPDDSADFVVKVYRDPSVPPTCAPYTVFMRNG